MAAPKRGPPFWTPPATHRGDTNGDGDVDIDDLNAVRNHLGTGDGGVGRSRTGRYRVAAVASSSKTYLPGGSTRSSAISEYRSARIS